MFSPFALAESHAYSEWRETRLNAAEQSRDSSPVYISDPRNIADSTKSEIQKRCRDTNMAFYQMPDSGDESSLRTNLRMLAVSLGMGLPEGHRSAGDKGIVALTVTDKSSQRGYIPYSRKAMNWHTDGYYNPPNAEIHSFILHCARDATLGGVNQILDPAIAYIRLRDESPAYIAALSHPLVMTIPANTEPDGTVRPASVGPVFKVDAAGNLNMRYTARTRSIEWRDDPVTLEAAAFLRNLLMAGDPLMRGAKLTPGQGIINNNVLHNRTGFDPDEAGNHSRRLIYRIRFFNRIGEI